MSRDDVQRFVSPGDPVHVLGRCGSSSARCFVRCAGHVRSEDYVVRGQQRVVKGERFDREDVEAGTSDLPGAKRVQEGGLVDAPGDVDEDRASFHLPERSPPDHVARGRRERDVHGDPSALDSRSVGNRRAVRREHVEVELVIPFEELRSLAEVGGAHDFRSSALLITARSASSKMSG